MQYTIVVLVMPAAHRAARMEGHPSWPLMMPAVLLGLPLLIMQDGPSYLISGGGWLLLALVYIVWRIRTSRALGTLEP